jgi:ABC-type bacteriocin/lantibiotic exporter with double-glycine peptidase domain
MYSFLEFLKRGLSRKPPKDRIAGKRKYGSAKENLKNLKPFFLRHWRKGLLGALLILFTSLLGLPIPLITRFLIDKVILAKQLELLAGTVILLVVVKLSGMLAGTLQQFYFTRFEQVVLLDIQHNLIDRTLHFPKSFFDSKEVGYLMSRLLGDVNGLRWFFSSTLVHIVSSVLRFIGGIALLFYLKWQLAIVVLFVLPLMILSVHYFARKLRILSHYGMEQQANVTRSVQESLSSTSLIKAFSSEKRTLRRLMSELRSALQIRMEQVTVGSTANLSIGLAPEIARVLVLIVGAYWVIKGQWTLGSLLAFLSYIGYVYGPAHFLATANFQLQNALAALERISALFNIVPEENLGKGKKVKKLKGEVEFKNVSFSYDAREPVLQNVSFKVKPGERVAIVGPSGVGKTTLISLILRFYKPTSGEIYFDGCPAGVYELSSLRKRIGYVSQNPILLSGTIMENIKYGNPEASEEQVIYASKTAEIHDFICHLPEGYKSKVGEKGVNLSEGQKQRLSIARALLKNPDILILDEPTSALDSQTEKSILNSLPSVIRNKTLFIVSHRLSTVRNCDRILLLDKKSLVAVGTHKSLSEANEYYRSLVNYQETGNRKSESVNRKSQSG